MFSGEAAAFIPGAHDPKAPAEEGNTGWAGEARLNAGTNFKVGSTPSFIDAESAIGCAPKVRQTSGTGT